MRKFLIASVTALTLIAIPTAAFAAKPVHPTTPASANAHPAKPPTVMFVMRGTLSNYTPTSGTTPSISITVKSSNFDKTTLKTMTLTFSVNSKTTVVLHNDKPIANGDRGIVKVRAPKNFDATALPLKTAFEIIDQGASS